MPGDDARRDPLDADVSGETVRALFLTLLVAASADSPWLVVLDDCQWADAASQQMIEFVADRLRGVPVCLVLLARDANPLTHVFTDLVDRIDLHDLDPEDSELLVRELLGGDDGDTDEIARRAGGNPLFLSELARHVRDGDLDTLPATLPGLVLSTVDHLPPVEQATLKAASVLGRTFHTRELVGCFGGDAPADVERALERLAADGFVPEAFTPSGPTHVFRSDTMQESLYESLSHANRRRLHEDAGSWFESEHAADLDSHLDLLAHHYGRSANRDKQRTYFALAGRRAARLFANEDAIVYFERLVHMLGDDTDASTLRELGELYAHVGRPVEAEEQLRHAIEARRARPRPLLARRPRAVARRAPAARRRGTRVAERSGPARPSPRRRLRPPRGLRGSGHRAAGRRETTAPRSAAVASTSSSARRLHDPSAEANARLDIAVNVEDQGRLDESYRELLRRAYLIVMDGAGVLRWRIEAYLFRVCEHRGRAPRGHLLAVPGEGHRSRDRARTGPGPEPRRRGADAAQPRRRRRSARLLPAARPTSRSDWATRGSSPRGCCSSPT